MACRCIIVEDELPAIKLLEKYIESLPQLELTGVARNHSEAANLLSVERVDLIFLNFYMPQLTCIELFRTLHCPPKVILTIDHIDVDKKTINLDAIDLLFKPISFEKFLKAVNKVQRINFSLSTAQFFSFGFVYFRAERKMIKVLYDEILYVESFRDYVIIHMDGDRKLRVKLSLNQVDEMLPARQFLRIHRSYIVSVIKITAFTKTDVEIGRTELPIGKSFTSVFYQLIPHPSQLPSGVADR